MDTYIDNSETQVYGPALRRNMVAAFASSEPPVKSLIGHLAGRQAAADDVVAKAMAKARGATADLSASATEKRPEVAATRKLLSGLHKHLASKQDLGEWSGKVETFFPKGLGAIGGAADVLAAVRVARSGLAKDASVPDGKKLDKRLADAEKKLAALLEKSGDAGRSQRSGLSEQSKEKKAWLATYRGVVLVVEGLLAIEGRAKQVRQVVPHYGVSGGRKTKKAPVAKTGT